MKYAYSIIETKAMEESGDKHIITGMATTPAPDRTGDIVEPMGAKFETPMPLLWQHDADKPVGTMTRATPTKNGIEFTAEIPKVSESGSLKDRVDEAIQSVKYGLIKAVSIGFRILDDGYETLEDGGFRIKQWEWLELSLVTIPANSQALISAVKQFDAKHLPASGPDGVAQETLPGIAGKTVTLIPWRPDPVPSENRGFVKIR